MLVARKSYTVGVLLSFALMSEYPQIRNVSLDRSAVHTPLSDFVVHVKIRQVECGGRAGVYGHTMSVWRRAVHWYSKYCVWNRANTGPCVCPGRRPRPSLP